MISALKSLPPDEVGDVDALTDAELDALWADRQESLRKWSEQLSDAGESPCRPASRRCSEMI